MKNFTQKFIVLLALVFSMVFSINAQEIGDLYEGGYIFQINEDGTGLVADLQDLGLMNWDDAMDTTDVYTSQGYDDWYLPSKEELELIYNTIGTSSDDNIGGFDYSWYWSSSEYSSNYAWFVSFGNGGYDSYDKTNAFNVRVIRSVTFDTEVSGCTDSSANNYNVEATIDDESCTYAPVILLTPPTVEFTNGETLSLVSSQDLWDLEAIYDADNSLEELTITLSVNPDKINLVWDGGINSNPTVSAVSDFSGSTEIEICISDAISSVCGSNIIIVYEDSSTEEETADKYLDLPEGWSMFGYTCIDSVDAIVGFSSLSDKIEIVKDEWGLSYIPSWEFNAMGSLKFSEGYQIKMTEEVTDFQFCEAIVPEDGITQADVDAAVAEVHAMYDGWCESDVDNDGVCDIDEVSGCVESNACNYNANATDDDGSCAFAFAFFDCSGLCLNDDNDNNICDELEVFGCMNETYCNYNELANMDDGSCEGLLGCTVELFSEFNPDATCDDGSCEIVYVCMDEASPNYQPWVIHEAMMYGGFPIHDDSMCGQEGCMIEQGCNYDPSNEFGSTDLCEFPEEGFDCNGNIFNINELQIGDYYAGGIVYILNDDGTGWVVNPIQNTVWMSSGSYSEYINQANSNINNVTNGDYGDWQLAGYNDYVTLSELFGPLSSESPQLCNQDDYSWGFNDDNPNIMSDSDASFVFCNGDLQAPMWWYYPNVNYRLVRAF